MDAAWAVELLKAMVLQAVVLTVPLLLVGMIIGLGVSLFQAVTSIHEQTLTFVPKALGVIGTLLLLLPWMLRTTVEFTVAVLQRIPQMAP
ncbi:MAG: flagellar biosynthetic protein FliQ [Verrucomicrobiae bacterium]|nr:flagellar biosynthetic protein FliQ [Verrucomicrobiae bacterium]MCX7915840.1 flagellar biosynthetic protein FliQ [Verrucomicrobiae bacterium]MDW8343293.1 flagellar biosynthetic protein FliQ [Verrucomicrobiae bacterium]